VSSEELIEPSVHAGVAENGDLNGHSAGESIPAAEPTGRVVLADNLTVLSTLRDSSVDLIYVDPPFNTGSPRTLERLRTVRDEAGGDRTGFQGRRYRTIRLGSRSYADTFDDYLEFLEPRLVEFRRVLTTTGSLYVHLDLSGSISLP